MTKCLVKTYSKRENNNPFLSGYGESALSRLCIIGREMTTKNWRQALITSKSVYIPGLLCVSICTR